MHNHINRDVLLSSIHILQRIQKHCYCPMTSLLVHNGRFHPYIKGILQKEIYTQLRNKTVSVGGREGAHINVVCKVVCLFVCFFEVLNGVCFNL